MDSALTLAIAIELGYTPAVLHLNYRQKTEEKELQCFLQLAEQYKIQERLIVDIEYLRQIGKSSLTDDNIPVTNADLNSKEIPSSYVPFRNGNILSIASSWAEVINANAIFIGAMQLDSSGYPDCRREFFDSFEKSINLGTKPETKISIITPLIDFTKSDVVQKGLELKVPFEKTWSCYKESEIACGVCDSCALRLRGFQLAGANDPIKYKI
mgnify:CR=1 FL=1